MPQEYNPIIRTYCRLRSEFVNTLGVSRRQVRPKTPLATLIPIENRRILWRRLRHKGFKVPPLEISPFVTLLSVLFVLAISAAFISWLQSWTEISFAVPIGSLFVIPIGRVVFHVNQRWAVHFPENWLTVGNLALRLTPFGEHVPSGGWWTREDIAKKVRLVLADCLNIDAKDIRPENTLRELGAE
jgi:hypothetical protein